MGNPPIRPAADTGPVPPAVNGILAFVGGDFIAAGARLLPPPGQQEEHDPVRVVDLEVPQHGLVRITYHLNSYKHGRSRHWHWKAERADKVEPA